MSTQSRKDGTETPPPVNTDEIAAMQKQMHEKERRLREEERALEQRRREEERVLEKRRREEESKDSVIEALRRENELLRASQASTSRRELDPPTTQPPNQHAPRCYDSEYHDNENVLNFALREAVASIPTFDGQGSSVLKFARACRQARSMIPRQMEVPLTKLIKGKLRGRAYAAVEDSDCYSIESLCDLLKETFGPRMDIDQIKGDLAHIYMRKGEHILDYISRVKDLRSAILDCDRDLIDTREVDELTAKRFIKGLPNQLYCNMHHIENQPLSTVFREAIHIYQRLELEESRLGRPTTDTRRVQFSESRNIRPREPDMDSPSYRRRSDSWRSSPPRYEHASRYEPPRSPRYEPPRNTTGPNRRVPPADRFCRYCKVPGHDIHECERREFNNSRRSGNDRTLPPRNGSRREEQPQRVQTVTQTNEPQKLRVASLRPTENNTIPRVKLNSPQLNGPTEFMLDTGAEPNLIKFSTLKEGTVINAKDRLTLQGITEERVETLGSTQVEISGRPVEFHIVPDSLPITTEGLLGTSFCLSGATISYPEQHIVWGDIIIPFSNNAVTIAARSIAYISLRATGPSIAFLRRRQLAPDVTIPDALVRCKDGQIHTQCINTASEPRIITAPIIELEEVERISPTPPPLPQVKISDVNTRILTVSSKTAADRIQKLKNTIPAEHLNEEEREHVADLINSNYDLFHLPGDALGKTNVVTHNIPTIDDMPIHTKQYRYPLIHREEIDKQMKELLESDIVRPSKSPYNSPLWIVPKKPDAQGNKRWRMVIDYRALNEKSIPDAYPLPSILEILDQLGSAKYFSVFDLANGFH